MKRLDLTLAPFRFDPTASAEVAGIEMVNAFAHLTDMESRATAVFRLLMSTLGIDAAHPVAVAGLRLAADIDQGGGGGHANPYHNTRHLCEVMLSAHYIGMLQGFAPEASAEVILSALMHDYAHDGKRNGETPFRLERQSVTMSLALFGDAALDAGTRERVVAAVLATEFMQGQPYAMACVRAHMGTLDAHGADAAQGAARAALDAIPSAPAAAPELAVLARDAQAALQALVLCEADVLPSVGLTFSHALKLQAELSAEWDTALDVNDKLRFIDEWLKRTILSLHFKPNVDVVRRLLVMSLQKESAR